MPFETLVAGSLAYVALMFGVAFAADRAAARGRAQRARVVLWQALGGSELS